MITINLVVSIGMDKYKFCLFFCFFLVFYLIIMVSYKSSHMRVGVSVMKTLTFSYSVSDTVERHDIDGMRLPPVV